MKKILVNKKLVTPKVKNPTDNTKVRLQKPSMKPNKYIPTFEDKVDEFLGYPMLAAHNAANMFPNEDPQDNVRHALAGMYTAENIKNKTGNIPFLSKALGFIGSTGLGAAHEASTFFDPKDDRSTKIKLKEAAEDMYNNTYGAYKGAYGKHGVYSKKAQVMNKALSNQLPDGRGEKRPFKNNLKWTDPYDKKAVGTRSAEVIKDGPTIENAKKLKAKKSSQIFPTPTLGMQQAAINRMANDPRYKTKEKTLAQAKAEMRAMKPQQLKASGKADMTVGPIDAAIAGVAGIPGLVGRGLSAAIPQVVGALNTPLTTAVPGVTTGNILGSYAAADAITNRLPQVPGQIKRKEYGAAAGNLFTGALDILGARYGAGSTVTEGKSLYNANNASKASLANKVVNSNNNVSSNANHKTFNYPNNSLSFSNSDLVDVATADNFIRNKGTNIVINELNSREGVRRLRNQFKLANPNYNNAQLDYLTSNRLMEAENATRFNRPRWFLENGRGQMGTKSFGMPPAEIWPEHNAYWAHFNPNTSFQNNRPYSGHLFTPQYVPPSATSLTKPSALSKFSDPDFKPGAIALGTGFEENPMILDHEIGHSLQKGGAMPIDIQLRRLLPANNKFDKFWTKLTNNRFTNSDYDEVARDKNYFDVSNNRTYNNEAYPFAVEQRRKMIERGILNDRYDKITPWKLLKTRIAATKNTDSNFIEGDRLIKFTPPWKYGGLSKIMNEAPAVLPAAIGGAGAAAVGANKLQEQKNGNKSVKYKEGSKGVSLAFSRGEKDPKGGLTQKGVDKYNRATGGNLKMAVTTPPSKLKAGSKPANRRKSFCARMGGMPGPMKKPNGEPSRKALALRKWNC